MIANVGNRVGDVVGYFVVAVNEESFAKTETAVSATHVVDEQQRGVSIFVFEAFESRVGMLVRSIHLSKIVDFLKVRHHDPSNRIFGIVPVDERLVVFVGAESKLLGDRTELMPFRFTQRRNLFELIYVSRANIDEIHEVTPLNVPGPREG